MTNPIFDEIVRVNPNLYQYDTNLLFL